MLRETPWTTISPTGERESMVSDRLVSQPCGMLPTTLLLHPNYSGYQHSLAFGRYQDQERQMGNQNKQGSELNNGSQILLIILWTSSGNLTTSFLECLTYSSLSTDWWVPKLFPTPHLCPVASSLHLTPNDSKYKPPKNAQKYKHPAQLCRIVSRHTNLSI